MTLRYLLSGLTILAGLAQPASALTFNFTTKSGDTLTAEQAAAFQAAANVWSASLSDAITVNVAVGFASLGTNVLGQTASYITSRTNAAMQYLLRQDEKDATDAQAVDALSSSVQTNIAITTAQAKALGTSTAAAGALDGTIEFSTGFTFSTSRNADGSIAAGTYDLIGIAEHEIGHLLGFVSSVDGGTSGNQSLLDQFRYSAAGTRSVASGATAYFSIDNGATDLANFSNGVSNQASHWAIGTNGVMVPEAAAGTTQNITALDLLAMDTIGYDLIAVPEPWSISLLAVGALAAVRTRRRA